MVNILDKSSKQPQAQNDKVRRVNRRALVFFILAAIMVTMACSNSYLNYEGKFSRERIIEEEDWGIILAAETPGISVDSTEEPPVSIPEPAYQPERSQGSVPVTNNAGTNEYSVSAQDFSCICSVDGNVNVELRVNGDQLEIVDPSGGVQVYDKIGENTYKRSWMGYYILTVDGQDTQVDEEKSVVVFLTDTGYVMEHYSGSEGSPCCVHTFTQTK